MLQLCGRGQLKCDGTRAETDFFFRRNGRVHLNRRGRQFSRLLAAEVCASAVVMLDTPCSEVVWRVLATHSIALHCTSRASPCAITFQLESTLKQAEAAICSMFSRSLFAYPQFYGGGTRWPSWWRHCATNQKVVGSINFQFNFSLR